MSKEELILKLNNLLNDCDLKFIRYILEFTNIAKREWH